MRRRVEWTRLDGSLVEKLLANLVYNEHPRTIRFRPSQGDFGIDLLTPMPTSPVVMDVRQIKSFTANLGTGQKQQIEESFSRALIGLVRQDIPLGDWYLVMPLDPTPQNFLDWFRKMPDKVIEKMEADPKIALSPKELTKITEWREAPGRIIDWRGLVYCEDLAAKYPYVDDYYIHGNNERIRETVNVVAGLIHGARHIDDNATNPLVTPLAPGELSDLLGKIQATLKGDPHYRYGISLDEIQPVVGPEQNLIAATQAQHPDGWITFKIYARFAEATNGRPIPVQLDFHFENPAFDQDAFDAWAKYGQPFDAPATVTADLPGGLGGTFEGTARVTPAKTPPHQFRLRVAQPDGSVSPELLFTASTAAGVTGTGRWTRGTDETGLLTTEGFIDTDTLKSSMSFSTSTEINGLEAATVSPVLEFAAMLARPNRVQIGNRFGPFRDLFSIEAETAPVPPAVIELVRSLATIQGLTGTPIRIPALSDLTAAKVQEIHNTAALARGNIIVGTWTSATFDNKPQPELMIGESYKIDIEEQLVINLDGVDFQLGTIEHSFLSAKIGVTDEGLMTAQPGHNDVMHKALLSSSHP